MTLLERFIEVNGWSTSRKTVLLMAVTLPAHLMGWAVLYGANVDPHAVDMKIVHRVVAFGAVGLVVCLMAGAAMALAGREGRWTGYLVSLLYGGYVITVIQAAGNWSTPFFAWYPIGVMVLTLWFDERIGIFAFLLGLGWLHRDGRQLRLVGSHEVRRARQAREPGRARLQGACEPGRVMISQATWLLIREEIECLPRGEVTLKGISRPVVTFELATAKATVTDIASARQAAAIERRGGTI